MWWRSFGGLIDRGLPHIWKPITGEDIEGALKRHAGDLIVIDDPVRAQPLRRVEFDEFKDFALPLPPRSLLLRFSGRYVHKPGWCGTYHAKPPPWERVGLCR